MNTKASLTHAEIVVACRNVGVDLSCDACAAIFYTGATFSEKHSCRPCSACCGAILNPRPGFIFVSGPAGGGHYELCDECAGSGRHAACK